MCLIEGHFCFGFFDKEFCEIRLYGDRLEKEVKVVFQIAEELKKAHCDLEYTVEPDPYLCRVTELVTSIVTLPGSALSHYYSAWICPEFVKLTAQEKKSKLFFKFICDLEHTAEPDPHLCRVTGLVTSDVTLLDSALSLYYSVLFVPNKRK